MTTSCRSLLICVLLVTTLAAHAVQVNLTVQPARCGMNNGRVIASASGGLAPYSYSWSNGSTGSQITGHTSTGASPMYYFQESDTYIDYTVRFQNTGTDTAFTVVIRDEIDTDLALVSLEFLGASHAFTPSFGEGRELVLTFPNILLPDSTTDLVGSQGFVSYRIKPRDGIQLGDVFTNTAAIHFDFNDPIITNTVEHVVNTSTAVVEHWEPGLHPWPVPTRDVLHVPFPDGSDRTFSVRTMDGRLLSIGGLATDRGVQLDVRPLASGIYLLSTATGTTRFVKQ